MLVAQLLEFLTHSISDKHLGTILHPKDPLSNNYVTAVPFIHFANLIYFKALILSVAACTFPTLPNKKN
jgi:hypothetical protein